MKFSWNLFVENSYITYSRLAVSNVIELHEYVDEEVCKFVSGTHHNHIIQWIPIRFSAS